MSSQVGTSENSYALSGKLDELRCFIDRRFAELSTELHASVQLIDYSEANLSGQIAAIKEQIAAVLALPAISTRNSGVELEAVVQATEQAANQIMEAAEAIGDWLLEITAEPLLRDRIYAKVNAIFEACSFHDLTSQRIRRAIDHLQQVEAMLGTISMSGKHAPQPHSVKPDDMETALAGQDLAQAAIDQMLAA